MKRIFVHQYSKIVQNCFFVSLELFLARSMYYFVKNTSLPGNEQLDECTIFVS